MRETKTFLWDGADHLRTEEDVIACLDVALQEEDPCVIALTLDDICRSDAMSRVAPIQRENLRKALSADSNLDLGTVLSVVRALGLRLRAEPAAAPSGDCDTGVQTAESRRRAPSDSILRRKAKARG